MKRKEVAKAKVEESIEDKLRFQRDRVWENINQMNRTDNAEELEALCQWSKNRIDAIYELNSQRVAGKEITP